MGVISAGIGSTASKLGMHFPLIPSCLPCPPIYSSGNLDSSAYVASKFAIRGLAQCAGWSYGFATVNHTEQYFAALELRKHNITVNTVAPGAIATSMSELPPKWLQ